MHACSLTLMDKLTRKTNCVAANAPRDPSNHKV
jgi:hypothetical protein